MIFYNFKKCLIFVNCRKSNKKVFLGKSIYINGFKKMGKFFLFFNIAFSNFVSYNGFRQKMWEVKNMVDNDILDELTVIKRNGKKVPFDGAKIALAIKKGFDSVEDDYEDEEEKNRKYSSSDIQKVYQAVLKKIQKDSKEKNNKFKIEEIQDYIEGELSSKGYDDVYQSFSSYRERRNQSRESFFGDNKTHKFLKSLENLGLKSANEEDAKRRDFAFNAMYIDFNVRIDFARVIGNATVVKEL